jgi:glycosyltransferase involved in cell wall biosynthesis
VQLQMPPIRRDSLDKQGFFYPKPKTENPKPKTENSINKPRVSVIIPTYNRRAMALEAAASVLAQTSRDFELIVVDDGSDDGSAAALAALDGRLRLLRHPERRGVSAARNTGMAAAQGEWLAFLDSDDLWWPEKLAQQLDYIAGRPEALICQTDEIWVRRGVRVNKPQSHRKAGGWIFQQSLKRCMVSPSAAMLHRRLAEAHGGFDESLPGAEDYDLWLRLTWRYPVGLIPAPLVIKRGGHADQLSGQWGLDRWRIQALLKLLDEPELPDPCRQAARSELARRAAIYAQGCAKRGRREEARRFEQLAENTPARAAVLHFY